MSGKILNNKNIDVWQNYFNNKNTACSILKQNMKKNDIEAQSHPLHKTCSLI